MFEVCMTWNLLYFYIFEQCPFYVGFREEIMRHPRHCLANHPGFSSNIITATHFSTLTMTPMLAHHSTYSQWQAAPSTPPTLLILTRYAHLHSTHASFPSIQAIRHSSTAPTKARYLRQLTLRFSIHEKSLGID